MIREIFFEKKTLKIKIPKIIAEIGVHHDGNLELAKKYIDKAYENGADAVKFQSYKASTIATKKAASYWDLKKNPIKSQYKLFSQNDKFWKKEFEELKTYSDKIGIEFLSTPFDSESAYFLNDLCDVFKISSSDLNNKPFIELISNFKKPILLSTGASSLNEINTTIKWIKKSGVHNICLLHCVLNYPTEDDYANLNRIKILQEEFKNCIVGYSDHTLPKDFKVLISSYLLGAKVIEKHFSINKSLPGNDHFHSFDSNDLNFFKSLLVEYDTILGVGDDDLESQKISRLNARRSCVSKGNIKAGSIITEQMITFKRPGHGVQPKDMDKLIGKISLIDIQDDTTLLLEMFK